MVKRKIARRSVTSSLGKVDSIPRRVAILCNFDARGLLVGWQMPLVDTTGYSLSIDDVAWISSTITGVLEAINAKQVQV